MVEQVPHRRTVPAGTPEAEVIDRLTAIVGERLYRRFDEINDSMNSAISEGIDELDDAKTIDMMHASVEGNITTILHMLRHGIPLTHIQPITAATEYAVRLAQNGVPAASLRRAYHFGSDDLLAQIFDEVRQLDIDPDLRLRLLHHLAGWLHSYVDWITRVVSEAYEEERRQIDERSASIVASLVRSVLHGGPGAVEQFTDRTGYRLDQHHIAAVLWSASANPGIDQTETLHRVARALAETIRGQGPLFTAVDRSTAWVWFGLGARGDQVDTASMRRALAQDLDVRLALGRVRSGVEGFRRSHRDAEAAHDVAILARSGEQAIAHGDRAVVMLSMMLHDRDALSAWVIDVLGPLAAPTEGAERLRETLATFLRCGQNYQAAADQLMLHRNTVKYRVKRAQELRGRAIEPDRLDVEVALEAARVLGEVVLG